MPVPKTPAKPKAKAKAKNDAKTKDGTMLAKRRRSTKAMRVWPGPKAAAQRAAQANNGAKTKDGTIKVPFMGTGTTMMPDYARKAPDPPVDMAGGALPQVVLQQSWHIDTRDVPEIWIDASLLAISLRS